MKLLEKAGTDERLTPRLLREKTAQKMKLAPEDLKKMKTEIMKLIIQWWDNAHPDSRTIVSRLSILARAVGKGPNFFKDINLQESHTEKAKQMRKR